MTFQNVRLKLTTPSLKLKSAVRFTAQLVGSGFVTVSQSSSLYKVGADYTLLDASPPIDTSLALVAVWDISSKSWKTVSLSSIAAATTVDQHITAAGPATVLNNAGTVRVDQTVGASITLNLPVAANKTSPVLIADWKGDAGTNNITIIPSGTEKIQGRSQWVIAGDTGSVFLRPVSGVGYAL